MNLFDPSRPHLSNGSPAMTYGGAVSALYIIPRSPEVIRILVFQLVELAHSAKAYECDIPREELGRWLDAWIADPEAQAATAFGYTGPRPSGRGVPSAEKNPGPSIASTHLTAEDLDL